jgi:hypothetical protein
MLNAMKNITLDKSGLEITFGNDLLWNRRYASVAPKIPKMAPEAPASTV